MNESRRDLLRKVSALPAVIYGFGGIAAAADCSGETQWQSVIAYTGGERVVYDDATVVPRQSDERAKEGQLR